MANNSKKLYIDGDEILYKVCSPNTTTDYMIIYKGKLIENYSFKSVDDVAEFLGCDDEQDIKLDKTKRAFSFQKHLETLNSIIEDIKKYYPNHEFVFCFSGPKNFRYEVATIKPYKGNRESSEKPPRFLEVKDYIKSKFKFEEDEFLEADDLLGIALYNKIADAIVTQDKDLKMIPGEHFNYAKDIIFNVSPEEADMFFLKQLLMGDSTDNIPGIRLIGDKKSDKMIYQFKDNFDKDIAFEFVKKAYKKAKEEGKLPETNKNYLEIIKEIGELLWIKRERDKGPWDYFKL